MWCPFRSWRNADCKIQEIRKEGERSKHYKYNSSFILMTLFLSILFQILKSFRIRLLNHLRYPTYLNIPFYSKIQGSIISEIRYTLPKPNHTFKRVVLGENYATIAIGLSSYDTGWDWYAGIFHNRFNSFAVKLVTNRSQAVSNLLNDF